MRWRPPSARAAAPGGAGFADIVLPHLEAAHAFARWLVRDATLAEDVTQDAMLRALRGYAGFAGGDARAWLLRIVRHVAYDALAARDRLAVVGLESDEPEDAPVPQMADPADDPEEALRRRQDGQRLERALAALPLELRECLVLRELDELSYRQIAQVVGVPIGTVMSRLWRARRALIEQGDQG